MIQAPSRRRYVGIDSIPHRAALFAHAGPLNAAAHYTELPRFLEPNRSYVQPVSHLLTNTANRAEAVHACSVDTDCVRLSSIDDVVRRTGLDDALW